MFEDLVVVGIVFRGGSGLVAGRRWTLGCWNLVAFKLWGLKNLWGSGVCVGVGGVDWEFECVGVPTWGALHAGFLLVEF